MTDTKPVRSVQPDVPAADGSKSADLPMPHAYLIHGTSTKDDDWFPWLEQAAGQSDPSIALIRLGLPNPFNPDPQQWAQAIDRQIPTDHDIVLVAHSLGCIAAIRWVERHQDAHNIGLVLVGAFDQPLPAYPMLDRFVEPAVDYDKVRGKLTEPVVITSKDDPIAPMRGALGVADRLDAHAVLHATGGHFLASDGFTSFPTALDELRTTSQAVARVAAGLPAHMILPEKGLGTTSR
jgi:predicted alpha/beta hydrolase family esterase